MDSGADLNFMDHLAAKRRNLMILPVDKTIQLANSQLSDVIGEAIVDVEVNGRLYKGLVVQIMKTMFVDLILGKEFLKRHKSVTFHFDGTEESLHIGNTSHVKSKSVCASATDKSDRLIPPIADVSDTCQVINLGAVLQQPKSQHQDPGQHEDQQQGLYTRFYLTQ